MGKITEEVRHTLGKELAALPTEIRSDGEDAKRFDLLLLKQQLAVLQNDSAFERLR